MSDPAARPAIRDARNLEIEVLRCIAIVFTLLQHVHTMIPYPQGWIEFPGRVLGFWTGVDLFFVVSGFVIMSTLLDVPARRASGQPVKPLLYAFWVRRAFRLLPTSWLWLGLPLVLSFALAPADLSPPFGELWRGALSALLNVHNFTGAYCWNGHREEPLCGSLLLSGHYWSLSLEEQFYLVLPVLLVLLPRRALIPCALAGIAVCWFTPRPLFSLASFLRVDGFLWGIVIALARNGAVMRAIEPRVLLHWPLRLLVAAMLVYAQARLPVVAGGLGIDLVGPHRSWAMAAIALVGALMVWIASYDRGYLFGRGPGLAPFVWIGSRSYSLYVIHLPVFMVMHRAAARLPADLSPLAANLVVLGCAVAISLALAEINYRWVEVPLRERGRGIAARWKGVPATAGADACPPVATIAGSR